MTNRCMPLIDELAAMFCNLSLREVTASGPTPGTQEWEYQVISATSEQDVIDQANKLGAQEWEMVGVVKLQGSAGWRAFFKRLKRDF